MNKLVEKKIKNWSSSLGLDDIRGGEILKYIGSEVVFISFTKNEENGAWENKIEMTHLDYIGDYDPMTNTYLVRHTLKVSGDVKETRILSNGFEWGDPDERGYTSRLLSLSRHYEALESEMYFERLREMYFSNSNVLGADQIASLGGKSGKSLLEHIFWIVAVIDTETDRGIKSGLLSFRISEVSGLSKRSKHWSFNLRDSFGDLVIVPKFAQDPETGIWSAKDFSYNGQILGDLKVIDIQCPKEVSNV